MNFEGEAEEIVRAALALCEAYVAWSFERGNSVRIGLLGDQVRDRFRDYLKLAHEDLFTILSRAEKTARKGRLIIVGVNDAPKVTPAEQQEG